MSRKPSSRRNVVIESEPLSIEPIMNLFVLLILFLLYSAAFITITVIKTSLPQIASATADASQPTTPERSRLELTVAITDKGFTVAGAGGVLKGQATSTVAGRQEATIPLRAGKDYDFVALSKIIYQVRKQHPLPTNPDVVPDPDQVTVIILPETEVLYDTIIKTMDATRDTNAMSDELRRELGIVQPAELFENAVLAAGIR